MINQDRVIKNYLKVYQIMIFFSIFVLTPLGYYLSAIYTIFIGGMLLAIKGCIIIYDEYYNNDIYFRP